MLSFLKEYNLTGYTILFPSVGVGNVAQLTTDLLISSLEMEKIAHCWHPAIVPIIGPRAFQHDTDSSTTACELYTSASKKVAIFQIRSPLVASLMEDFFHKLCDILIEQKIANLIILTSSHAYEKHFVDASPFEYVANELYLNEHKMSIETWTAFSGELIFGGGYANKLFNVATAKQIKALILFKYVSEGDNTPDATHLCGHLNSKLNILPKDNKGNIKLTAPISWKLLFGNSAPDLLY